MNYHRFALLLVWICLQTPSRSQSSFTVGDEVVFSGGPSQPPKSIQTGFKFEATLRGGGTLPATPGASAAGSGKTTGAANDDGGAGALAAEAERRPEEPPPGPPIAGYEDARDAFAASAPGRRAAAVQYMSRITAPEHHAEILAALQESLSDSDRTVCLKAAESLGPFGDASAGPQLVKLLWLNDDPLAIAAIHSLGQLKATPALADLKKIGDSDTGPVGQAARDAVAAISAAPAPVPSPKSATAAVPKANP